MICHVTCVLCPPTCTLNLIPGRLRNFSEWSRCIWWFPGMHGTYNILVLPSQSRLSTIFSKLGQVGNITVNVCMTISIDHNNNTGTLLEVHSALTIHHLPATSHDTIMHHRITLPLTGGIIPLIYCFSAYSSRLHIPVKTVFFFFFFFFFQSSGGWVKIKLKLPHFHVSDTCRVSI